MTSGANGLYSRAVGLYAMKTVKQIVKYKKQKEVRSVLPKSTVFEALVLAGEKEIGALMVHR
jgi:hypothetical protein